jgi:hypothetical protein
VRLDEGDDHIGATRLPAVSFTEHGKGLADPRCRA